MMRLGGNYIHVNASTSSVQKGESLGDTVETLLSYVQLFI